MVVLIIIDFRLKVDPEVRVLSWLMKVTPELIFYEEMYQICMKRTTYQECYIFKCRFFLYVGDWNLFVVCLRMPCHQKIIDYKMLLHWPQM